MVAEAWSECGGMFIMLMSFLALIVINNLVESNRRNKRK